MEYYCTILITVPGLFFLNQPVRAGFAWSPLILVQVARLSLAWTTDCLPLAVMLLAFSEARQKVC